MTDPRTDAPPDVAPPAPTRRAAVSPATVKHRAAVGHDRPAATASASRLAPRPRRATGITLRLDTPLGTMFATVTTVAPNGSPEPLEVFVQVGKAGSDTAVVTEALGRLISLALRLPSPLSAAGRLKEVAEQLSGIGGARQLGYGPDRVRSLPDALARVLLEFLDSSEGVSARACSSSDTATEETSPVDDLVAPGRYTELCPARGDSTLLAAGRGHTCRRCGHAER